MSFIVRPARIEDVPALNALMERSARELSAGYYSPTQTDAAIRHVFGVDSRLIEDETYFVVYERETLVGCGGWSKRRTLYGGDQRPVGGGAEWLRPESEPARIRAFFVAPEYARRGVGRLLLDTCVAAARDAGFSQLELMATLPGVPFYAALGFVAGPPITDILPDGTAIDFVPMRRPIDVSARH